MAKRKQSLDDLNTGNSGIVDTTFGNEDDSDEKVEAITEQQRHLAELMPSVQHIIDACDDEIDAVSDIRAYMKTLGENPKPEIVQAEYRARELYISYLYRLKDSIADRVSNAEAEANR